MASVPAVAAGAAGRSARLVHPSLAIPFVLLILCFAAWGAAANLTDVLVSVFRTIFDMSNSSPATRRRREVPERGIRRAELLG